MKAWLIMLTVVLFVAIFSLAGWSIESPVMRNPAGYGTIPPSSYRNGLVSNPNPIDATGNLLMTGNVRRGMHFRGTIPYRSTTSFSATLGSSALNSFLRDTAGSEDFGSRSNKYRVQPFYSPTQTVTTMVPGRSEVFNPMGMRIDDRVRSGTTFAGNGLLGLDSMPRAQTSHDQDSAAGDSDFQKLQGRYRPLVEPPSTSEGTSRRGVSLSSLHMEHLVPGQLGIRQHRKASPKGEYDREVRGRKTEDGRQKDENRKPISGLAPQVSDSDLTQYPGEEISLEDLKSRLELLQPAGSADVKPAKDEFTAPSGLVAVDQTAPSMTPTRPSDTFSESQDRRKVLEQIRKQIDALTKSVEAGMLDTRRESPFENRESRIENPESIDSRLRPADKNQDEKRPDTRAILGTLPKGTPDAAYGGHTRHVGEVGLLSTSVEGVPPSIRGQDARDTELHQRGRSVVSPNGERINPPLADYENLESFSRSRFNRHIGAAEDHLKAGRYYRAVDSFTLAAVYQPSNPVVLAGKGHALFAAGEYMSSALFLARVLAVQPDYTQVKVDLATMLGGAEKLAERIADVEQWLARSGSAQLQFLLSYVYFRTDRLNQAKQAVDAAYEKMPHSPAVVAMRTAIHQAAR